MEQFRIAIIEDEILIADNIAWHLEELGYGVAGTAWSYEEALKLIKVEQPDLVLIDIRLKGEKSGIQLAKVLQDKFGIPFIFLTSSTDPVTVGKAIETVPSGYITKPFSRGDLYIAIELAKSKVRKPELISRKVEIRNGNKKEWIPLSEILYLEVARAYVTIVTETKNIVLRQSLKDLFRVFMEGEMARIHRSYAVNLAKVEAVSSVKVILGGKELPLGPSYRESLLAHLRK